ncbi:MAG: hypothetical protein IPF48_13655 [Sphingomonadales bacterium]|nr:hypothetical protein [Sphingomonadales bacterium]
MRNTQAGLKSAQEIFHAIALAYNPWQVAVLVDGPSKITGLTPEPIDADHQRGLLVVTLGDKSTMNVSADLPTLTLRVAERRVSG